MPLAGSAVHPVATPARSDSTIPQVQVEEKQDSIVATCPTTKPAEVEAKVPTMPATLAIEPDAASTASQISRKAGLIRFDTFRLLSQDSPSMINTLQVNDLNQLHIPEYFS